MDVEKTENIDMTEGSILQVAGPCKYNTPPLGSGCIETDNMNGIYFSI